MKYKILIFFCAAILTFTFLENVRANTLISGKLLQSSGQPLAYTEIELVPIDSKAQINDARLLATSNVAGLFSFAGVPEGSYTLSINFDEKPSDTSPFATFFYPNAAKRADAKIFEIAAETRLRGLVFQLPPKLAQRKITGKVVTSEGKPVTDAFATLKDIEFDDLSLTFGNKTDKNGNFTLNGFENRKYIILVVLYDSLPSVYAPPGEPVAVGKSDFFALGANTAAFNIILKNTGRKSDVY